MWIKKKKVKELEKRIADLEVQVQSQQETSFEETADKVFEKMVDFLIQLKMQYNEIMTKSGSTHGQL